MKQERLKPYKEETPISTINLIRSIISSLGLLVSEKIIKNGAFFACRIEIINEGVSQYHIGTNGKGISIELALASAYGEFIERLQNKILFKNEYFFTRYFEKNSSFSEWIQKNSVQQPFVFDPNEKFIGVEDLLNDHSTSLALSNLLATEDRIKLYRLLDSIIGKEKFLCVPFYSLIDNRETYLPIDILLQCVSSTGMCAGNTKYEALVQGFSEILERYAIREIYTKQLTPPTISKEVFKEYDVFDEILQIEESGLRLEIKDFSLGIELPVIGVIVYDEENLRYNVKVGSDPWPITALQRCLTELHQSFNGIRLIEKKDQDYFNCLSEEERYLNLSNIYNTATGQWPSSIFKEEYSYSFSSLDFRHGISNETDFEFLYHIVKGLGYDVFIRNVSFANFPSYYIVIPGLSEDISSIKDYNTHLDISISLNQRINNLCSLSNQELVELANIIEKYYSAFKRGIISIASMFEFNVETDTEGLNEDIILSMIYYKLGNFVKSYGYLKSFLLGKEKRTYKYHYACLDYMSIRMRPNFSRKKALEYLSKFYGALAKDVVNDLTDNSAIFKYYDIQSMFLSTNADMNNFGYIKLSRLLTCINQKFSENIITQQDTYFKEELSDND